MEAQQVLAIVTTVWRHGSGCHPALALANGNMAVRMNVNRVLIRELGASIHRITALGLEPKPLTNELQQLSLAALQWAALWNTSPASLDYELIDWSADGRQIIHKHDFDRFERSRQLHDFVAHATPALLEAMYLESLFVEGSTDEVLIEKELQECAAQFFSGLRPLIVFLGCTRSQFESWIAGEKDRLSWEGERL